MDSNNNGLSVKSIKIIGFTLTILVFFSIGLWYLSGEKGITPYLTAVMIAVSNTILVILIVYLIVHEEGWDAIFPP
jgi:hypothetical protein